jgi:hypothetical protein
MPHLAIDDYSGKALDDLAFMQEFSLFMHRYPNCEVVADWPADFEHLCWCLTWGGSQNGWCVPVELSMRLISRQNEYNSAIPYNALSDARALRDYCNDWKI